MRSWLDFVVVLSMLLQAVCLGGCSVDADSLRGSDTGQAPFKGPGTFDAGTPDILPSTEAPRATPDAVPGVDGFPSPVDMGTASGPEARPADVLPAPDLAPGCPFVAWTRPSPAAERWGIELTAGSEATCFTVCGTLSFAWLASPPTRAITVNDRALVSNPSDCCGYMPAVSAVEGLWVVRFSSGSPTVLSLAGYPTNTTGACP